MTANSLPIHTIVVAGGSGTRMTGNIPKQFMLLQTKPILMHTIEKFYHFNPDMIIIVALPADQQNEWKKLCTEHSFSIPHITVDGGFTRFHSVKNALAKADAEGLIAVHDGVRPLVSTETLKRCYKTAEQHGTAVPVIPLNDSVRQLDDGKSTIVDRTRLRLVQTPQVFQAQLLHKAYDTAFRPEFTDDASVVERTGADITLVEGNSENIKITLTSDLIVASALLQRVK